ncbi:ABC transporter ATP-binding protein [Streptomyces sp. NPDC048290]|uniref:ABC transporter ATP-binding protein n=1 Tax=Streptomyces sp. NPDC048290 TaxID=3155811 RepID=UPI0034286581
MIDAYGDPGTPDSRGPARYLWWLVRSQPGRAAAGSLLASVWMVLLAATPFLMARAVDRGLARDDYPALVAWSAALFGVGVLNAWLSIMRHRTMTRVRMDAHFRTVKVVVDHSARLGSRLGPQTGAGEVTTIGVGDVQTIATALTVVGPGVGAVVAYGVVAALLLSVSPQLAGVVLLGVPLVVVLVGPLMRRLQGRETEYREVQGLLTARISDLAGGLRVLNGLGGKALFAESFRADSRRLRDQGYRVGQVTSWMQALGVGLPTVFLGVVSWLAARSAARGEITPGELVAVYGYVAVLVIPMAFLVECGHQISRAVVAADRVVRFLRLRPAEDTGTRPAPAEPSALHDPESGVRVLPGRLTALAADRPADATAILDRLSRHTESAATWGGIRLDEIPLSEVRSRILLADHEAHLFAGTLREAVGADGDAALREAIRSAAADDVVQSLPEGPDSLLDAQARNLSGGQRQRVRLVRALLADPEILLAVEPTSALDAHTEATVASRLRETREGRTTLLTTTSPLVLAEADTVIHVKNGKATAAAPHTDLLRTNPAYRALVSRDTEDQDR